MYPEFKKFSLLKDSAEPILTDHTIQGGSETILSNYTPLAGNNYHHVLEAWKCL